MKITILFDKEAKNKKLCTGWGVSFLIGENVLFDTGENSDWLLENMKQLRVDISDITKVVISHDHWDHTRGLWGLLRKKRGITVYACPGFSVEFKKEVGRSGGRLVEADRKAEIEKNIYVTGEIAGEYNGGYMPEQALVVKTGKGLTMATGCSHPGITRMVEEVRKGFPEEKIHGVFGGFHLMAKKPAEIRAIAKEFRRLKVEKAGPTHCSGRSAEEIFKDEFGGDCIIIRTGGVIDI